jgi:hypothetical protein
MIDLEVPEYKKDEEWYRKIAQFYASFYNRPLFINYREGEPLTPVQTMNRNLLYYYGEQPIGKNFIYIQGTAIESFQSRHNQIFTLVNSLHGKMVEFVTNFKAYAELLSPESRSQREKYLNELMFAVDNQEFLKALEMLSIFYNPIPEDAMIKTKEDVEEYAGMEWRSFLALIAERISEIVMKTSDYANIKPDQFLDLLICGVTSEDRELENGVVVEKKLMPQSLILDLRNPNDNNFNDAAQFRGYWINTASPYEIIEKNSEWLSEDAIEQIRACAESTQVGFGQWYFSNIAQSPTGFFDFYSFGTSSMRPINGMSGCRIYFRAKVDYRYYRGKKGRIRKYRDYDESGNLIKQNAERKGMVQNWRWHYVDLWGGYWVGKHGIVENAHYEDNNRGKDECPQKVYIDGLKNGVYKSRVSRLIEYQDGIDLADLKIKLAQYNDLGVNYIISEMGAESRKELLRDIFRDFKSKKMTVLKRDIEDDNVNTARFAEIVDFTKSLDKVQVYENIKQSYIRDMNNMMHMPDISQGLQKSTIGKAVQAVTVELANTGLAPLFTGYVNYIQKGLQLTVNKNKLAFIADDNDEDYVRMLIGDRGYELLKTAVYENYERIGIYIYPYDQMNSINQQRLDVDIQMGIQAGVISFADAQKIKTYTSFREAVYYLRKIAKQNEIAAREAAQQQRMDAMAMSQAELEAGIAAKQAPAEAAMFGAQQRADATKYAADKGVERDVIKAMAGKGE